MESRNINPALFYFNIISHSMKDLAFHTVALLVCTTPLTHFSLKVDRMYILNLGVKGLNSIHQETLQASHLCSFTPGFLH